MPGCWADHASTPIRAECSDSSASMTSIPFSQESALACGEKITPRIPGAASLNEPIAMSPLTSIASSQYIEQATLSALAIDAARGWSHWRRLEGISLPHGKGSHGGQASNACVWAG